MDRSFLLTTTIVSCSFSPSQDHLYLIQWSNSSSMFIITTIVCIWYNNLLSTSTVATNKIICIWYNVPHPWLPLPWSFVFNRMILLDIKLLHYHDRSYSIQRSSFHIHGCRQQDHLYLIQRSTSMVTTPMIICIQYNDPPQHQAPSLPWSFIFDTMILWSSWCLFYSLHSSPLSHNKVLTSSRLQHLCLALVLSDLLKPNDSTNLVNLASAEAWWRCQICYHPSVRTSLEFFHLWPPHRWNDIIDRCASSSHGIYCPLPARWLLDCRMRWWAVFLLLKSLSWNSSTRSPLHLRDVLRLCTQQRNDSLLLQAPWDCPDAKMERESGYWMPVLLTSPVHIAESFYHHFFLSSKGKPKIFCASEIVNDLF